MNALLASPGFLGTKATFRSDATLLLILFSAVLFTIGWRFAVGKHYQVHRWLMTTSATLNAFAILFTMISSFWVNILPGLPAKFFVSTYGVTTVHALVGAIGLLLGIFVVLRGNELVPDSLKFNNYKLFMRTSYGLYMLSTLGGIILYLLVFLGP